MVAGTGSVAVETGPAGQKQVLDKHFVEKKSEGSEFEARFLMMSWDRMGLCVGG